MQGVGHEIYSAEYRTYWEAVSFREHMCVTLSLSIPLGLLRLNQFAYSHLHAVQCTRSTKMGNLCVKTNGSGRGNYRDESVICLGVDCLLCAENELTLWERQRRCFGGVEKHRVNGLRYNHQLLQSYS